jgi:Zn-dependent membrane protease YugP
MWSKREEVEKTMFFGPGYFEYMLFMLPALILAGFATILTQSRFSKYSRFRAASGLTGAMAARRMLEREGLYDVSIEPAGGFLSDHYDPRTRTLRLSPSVYSSPSLAAIGVACHEAGHALQHATGYAALGLRTALVPAAQIGTYAPYVFFVLGALMNSFALIKIGILVFSLAVLFSVVTLPVEWNASARAKRLMVSTGIVSAEEQEDASKVLNAAFLTYLAGAVMALLQLLYYLMKFGLLGGRRND